MHTLYQVVELHRHYQAHQYQRTVVLDTATHFGCHEVRSYHSWRMGLVIEALTYILTNFQVFSDWNQHRYHLLLGFLFKKQEHSLFCSKCCFRRMFSTNCSTTRPNLFNLLFLMVVHREQTHFLPACPPSVWKRRINFRLITYSLTPLLALLLSFLPSCGLLLLMVMPELCSFKKPSLPKNYVLQSVYHTAMCTWSTLYKVVLCLEQPVGELQQMKQLIVLCDCWITDISDVSFPLSMFQQIDDFFSRKHALFGWWPCVLICCKPQCQSSQ